MANLPVVGRVPFVILALALSLAGCDNPASPSGVEEELEDARRTWSRRGYDSYTFRVSQLCFCVSEARGTFAVAVIRGQVVSVTDAETGAPRTPSPVVPLTVEALFAKVEDAIEQDADEIDVRYDPQLGYPMQIDIDYVENAIDDEVTYTATDLVPAR